MRAPHPFAGNPLDRGERERRDEGWIELREVLLALDGKCKVLSVPGPIAIAQHLIKARATRERF